MSQALSSGYPTVVAIDKPHPSVLLLSPFEPKLWERSSLEERLQNLVSKLEYTLAQTYGPDKSALVIAKLRSICKLLDYSTLKKSVVIFVSPLKEKLFYLDIPVEERYIIDEPFDIRNLILNRKETRNYLVLILSHEWSKVYFMSPGEFVRINLIMLNPSAGSGIGMQHEALNTGVDKQASVTKFLKSTDEGLHMVLELYDVPVFVMGPEMLTIQLQEITVNKKWIIEFIPGSFRDLAEEQMRNILHPYIQDWKKVQALYTIHQLEAARHDHHLAVGLQQVWKAAFEKRGKLLVTEKRFVHTGVPVNSSELRIAENTGPENLYLTDAVDEIIEAVLQNGGAVELVEDGMIDEYSHIALIENYHAEREIRVTHQPLDAEL